MRAPSPHFLMLAALSSGAFSDPGRSAPDAWRVRPDSREYCGELLARLSRLPAARDEPSRSLGQQGARLCEEGHVRTGVAKLRRAIRAAQAG